MAGETNGTNGHPKTNGKATYAEKHKVADHFIGGNRLENAPASKVKDFVAQNDGHTVITNVSLTPAADYGNCTSFCSCSFRCRWSECSRRFWACSRGRCLDVEAGPSPLGLSFPLRWGSQRATVQFLALSLLPTFPSHTPRVPLL